MIDSMLISGSNYATKSYALAQYTSSIDFVENTTYNFRARLVGIGAGTESGGEARLSIHISGSGFPSNHDLGSELGWQLETPDGELGYYAVDGLNRLDFGVVEEAFQSNPSGNATIQFAVWSGQWHVQDVSIRPATDTGFSPDWIKIVAPIPPFSMERPDEYEFITEFYDVNNNVAETIAHASSSTFNGGNQYIVGDNNVLSGSMVIGNAVGAGIEMAGYNSGYIRSIGYEGFASASQGSGWAGFLMYSGSVLPNSGDNYDGVGLELVSPGGSGSLRFSTNPSRFEVIAESFYVGSPTSQFISGSGGQIEISSSAFWLTPDGNVFLSGSITAGSGYIGGWQIIPGALYNQTGTDFTGMSTVGNTRFFAGASSLSTSGSGVFNVKASGDITGSQVLFTGGKIGNWNINSGWLVDDSNALKLDPDGQYIISSSDFQVSNIGEISASAGRIGGWDIGDTTLSGTNLILNSAGRIETGDYASGIRGWRIDESGEAEFENAHIRGTLSTVTFEKQSINAVGGQLWVANSSAISGSAVGISETTMSLVNASGFTADEYLITKKIGPTGFSQEIMTVVSASIDNTDTGAGRIMVTRGTSGSAAAYDEGQVIVSTGRLNTGYIKLNANPSDESTPYIDIIERTGSAYPDFELKARLGDLSGLSAGLVGANPGYGLYSQNVFLTGTITANYGNIGGFGITPTAISSSNDSLILRGDTGDITGSQVLFTGGKVGGWSLGDTKLESGGVRLEATGEAGLYIQDSFQQDIITVASKSMHSLGSSPDEIGNDSFEEDPGSIWQTDGYHIGNSTTPLTVPSWSLATTGPISHSITRRLTDPIFGQFNRALTGDFTFDFMVPGQDAPTGSFDRTEDETSGSYLNNPNNYELTQIISASSGEFSQWNAGNVVSVAFVAKASHSFGGKGVDRGLDQQKYRVDYWDEDNLNWNGFIPARSGSSPMGRYSVGSRWTSIKAAGALPKTTHKLRLTLSGSINTPTVKTSTVPLFAE